MMMMMMTTTTTTTMMMMMIDKNIKNDDDDDDDDFSSGLIMSSKWLYSKLQISYKPKKKLYIFCTVRYSLFSRQYESVLI